jgi:hypothetical protein
VNAETNATQPGAAGAPHTHDYWKGQDRVVIFQGEVSEFYVPAPPLPEGPGSTPHSEAFLHLPPPALVYEGTAKLEVLASDPVYNLVGDPLVVPAPVAPSITMQYETPADSKLSAGEALSIGVPKTIEVKPEQTDMPHSTSSLWLFKFSSDQVELASFNLTVTIVRGASIATWPGHPDLYARSNARTIFDQDVTRMASASLQDDMLYGGAPDWVQPTKIVGAGTGWLDVYANVTSFKSQVDAPLTTPDGFVLYVHNTSTRGDEPYEQWPWLNATEIQGQSYHFKVPVTPDAMDPPYAPASRWGFSLGPEFPAARGGSPVRSQLVPYELHYHLLIVANRG